MHVAGPDNGDSNGNVNRYSLLLQQPAHTTNGMSVLSLPSSEGPPASKEAWSACRVTFPKLLLAIHFKLSGGGLLRCLPAMQQWPCQWKWCETPAIGHHLIHICEACNAEINY